MTFENNPADDIQPTKEEREAYEKKRNETGLQRYELDAFDRMTKKSDGSWVDYHEHKELVNSLKNRVEKLEEFIRQCKYSAEQRGGPYEDSNVARYKKDFRRKTMRLKTLEQQANASIFRWCIEFFYNLWDSRAEIIESLCKGASVLLTLMFVLTFPISFPILAVSIRRGYRKELAILKKRQIHNDICPECHGELDTGWECNDCGYDGRQ